MCGIIGIVTAKEADVTTMLQKSLSWLTYRGYDSWGIAVKVGNELKITKNIGFVVDHRLKPGVQNKIGIGHTRWATHGVPSQENAHPHADCTGNIAVVHNGIIDNYRHIKERLEAKGHRFESDTDTEIIPHLIEEKLKGYVDKKANPFLWAFRDALKELEGTFAISAIWNKEEKIYAVKKTNPLVIGIKGDMKFVSSDIPAFHEYTDKFVPLEDYQIAEVSARTLNLYDFDLNPVIAEEYTCHFTAEEISKSGYDHYMQKEMEEQAKILGRIRDEEDGIRKVAEGILGKMKRVNKVFFLGCGSSFHACLAGKHMVERILHIPSEAIISSEFRIASEGISFRDSLLIVVSQSGETLDTYIALENILSHSEKPDIIVLDNFYYSSVERLVRREFGKRAKILHLLTGPEICVVATKTYVAQLYLLALLTLHIGLGIAHNDRRNEVSDLLREAERIPEKVQIILDETPDQIRRLTKKYGKFGFGNILPRFLARGYRGIFFMIGRGINLATAYETALKLKEICYAAAEGIAGGELKHGSLAVVDESIPVFVFFPPSQDGKVWRSTLNNFMEVQARGAPIIALCSKGDETEEIRRLSEDIIELPHTDWLFCPILQIIPLQLLSYNIALQRSIDPDHPRNLAKTVTVE